MNPLFLYYLLLCLFYFYTHNVGFVAGDLPFTPKASLIRYWKKQISNDVPKPWFFLNKASPLNGVQSASFTKLASQNLLSTNLPSFCSSANLLCFPDLPSSLDKHDSNSNFVSYQDKNFTNYGMERLDGVDSFKNYSDSENLPVDSFRRYSREAVGHSDKFSNYAPEGNVIEKKKSEEEEEA